MIEARKLVELYHRVDCYLSGPDKINQALLKQVMTEVEEFLEESGYCCSECGQYRPDDDRVIEGLRCGQCVYGGE